MAELAFPDPFVPRDKEHCHVPPPAATTFSTPVQRLPKASSLHVQTVAPVLAASRNLGPELAPADSR
jgi:hypothetical protein